MDTDLLRELLATCLLLVNTKQYSYNTLEVNTPEQPDDLEDSEWHLSLKADADEAKWMIEMMDNAGLHSFTRVERDPHFGAAQNWWQNMGDDSNYQRGWAIAEISPNANGEARLLIDVFLLKAAIDNPNYVKERSNESR